MKASGREDPFAVALLATQSWALQPPADIVQAISSQKPQLMACEHLSVVVCSI